MGSNCGRSKVSCFRLPIVAFGVIALLVLTPASTLGVVQIAEVHDDALADFDSRAATVEPAAASVAAARSLGATARWSEFSTLQSLIKHGGFLATEPPQRPPACRQVGRAVGRSEHDDLVAPPPKLLGRAGHVVVHRVRLRPGEGRDHADAQAHRRVRV